MNQATGVDFAIVGFFFLITLGVGLFERKRLSLDDYWVNGRDTNAWLLVATTFSTFVGANSIIGNATIAYSGAGLAAFVFPLSYFLYFLVFARFFAPRIKAFGDRTGAYTLPDYLLHRYSPRVRTLGAVVNICAAAMFLSVQFLAVGMLTSSMLGIDPVIATLAAGGLVITYSALGGMRADIRTDVFQAIVMSVLMVSLLPILFERADGFNAVFELPKSFLSGGEFAPPWVFVSALLFLGAGTMTSAELWQRSYAGRSEISVRRAMTVSSFLVLLFLSLGTMLGLFGRVILPDIESNAMFVELLRFLPAGLYGLICAGVFAAVLSTADTLLLILSMSVVHDFRSSTEATMEDKLRRSRLFVVLFGLIAMGVTISLFHFVHQAITAISFSVTLFPALAFGFFTSRGERAAFWSILVALLVLLVATCFDPVSAFIPSLIGGAMVYWLVPRDVDTERYPPVRN